MCELLRLVGALCCVLHFRIKLVVVFNVTLVIWVLFAPKSFTEAAGCGDVIKQEKLQNESERKMPFSIPTAMHTAYKRTMCNMSDLMAIQS